MDAPLEVHRVPAEHDGARIDAFLRERGAGSLQRARRLLACSTVALGGVVADARARLREGDEVAFRASTAELSLQLGIGVVFCDDDVLVLHKPPGFAVHGGPLVDDSVAQRLRRLGEGLGLAQRLDRGASGLLLCGRHTAALAELSAAMQDGAIEREYLAIAAGTIEGDERTIDLPLRVLDEPAGNRPKVVVDHDEGRPATTHLRVLGRAQGRTLVALRLATGRTHQIRAHLAAIGNPLLGDPRYGDPAVNERARQTHGVARPLLHCHRLALALPDRPRCTLASFLEPDFARLSPATPR